MNNPLKYTDPSGWYVATGTDFGRDIIELRGVTFYDYGVGSPGNFSSGSGSNTSIGSQLTLVEGPNGSAWVNNSEYNVLYEAGKDPVSELKSLFDFVTPVAFTVGIDLDVIIGTGGEMSPGQLTILFSGPDSGKVFSSTDASKPFQAVGWDLSGSIEGVFWFFTGDATQLNA
jgi:hypothetical protein